MEFPSTQLLPDDLYEDNVVAIFEKAKVGILIVEESKQLGLSCKEFPIYEGDNMIGRHDSCQIAIPLAVTMSKKHSCIEAEKCACYIYDCGSSNKTKLGNLCLKPEVRYCLNDGDSITFGNVKCLYKQVISQSEPSSPTASSDLLALDTPDTTVKRPTEKNLNESFAQVIPDSQGCRSNCSGDPTAGDDRKERTISEVEENPADDYLSDGGSDTDLETTIACTDANSTKPITEPDSDETDVEDEVLALYSQASVKTIVETPRNSLPGDNDVIIPASSVKSNSTAKCVESISDCDSDEDCSLLPCAVSQAVVPDDVSSSINRHNADASSKLLDDSESSVLTGAQAVSGMETGSVSVRNQHGDCDVIEFANQNQCGNYSAVTGNALCREDGFNSINDHSVAHRSLFESDQSGKSHVTTETCRTTDASHIDTNGDRNRAENSRRVSTQQSSLTQSDDDSDVTGHGLNMFSLLNNATKINGDNVIDAQSGVSGESVLAKNVKQKRGLPESDSADSGVAWEESEVPIPQNDLKDNDVPVPQSDFKDNDVSMAQNNLKDNDVPMPQSDLKDNDVPISQNNLKDNDVPMPQSDLKDNDVPMSQSNLKDNDFPMVQNDLKDNDVPMPQSDLKDNDVPMSQNNLKDNDVPMAQNDLKDNDVPMPQSDLKDNDVPIPQSDLKDNDVPMSQNNLKDNDFLMVQNDLKDNNVPMPQSDLKDNDVPMLQSNLKDNDFPMVQSDLKPMAQNDLKDNDVSKAQSDLNNNDIPIPQSDLKDNDVPKAQSDLNDNDVLMPQNNFKDSDASKTAGDADQCLDEEGFEKVSKGILLDPEIKKENTTEVSLPDHNEILQCQNKPVNFRVGQNSKSLALKRNASDEKVELNETDSESNVEATESSPATKIDINPNPELSIYNLVLPDSYVCESESDDDIFRTSSKSDVENDPYTSAETQPLFDEPVANPVLRALTPTSPIIEESESFSTPLHNHSTPSTTDTPTSSTTDTLRNASKPDTPTSVNNRIAKTPDSPNLSVVTPTVRPRRKCRGQNNRLNSDVYDLSMKKKCHDSAPAVSKPLRSRVKQSVIAADDHDGPSTVEAEQPSRRVTRRRKKSITSVSERRDRRVPIDADELSSDVTIPTSGVSLKRKRPKSIANKPPDVAPKQSRDSVSLGRSASTSRTELRKSKRLKTRETSDFNVQGDSSNASSRSRRSLRGKNSVSEQDKENKTPLHLDSAGNRKRILSTFPNLSVRKSNATSECSNDKVEVEAKVKRRKMALSEVLLKTVKDDRGDDPDDDLVHATALSLRPRREKPRVMFTGVIDKVGESIVTELGGHLTADMHECTHLVTDKMRRTVKFLCAAVRGIHIVNQDWLRMSKQQKRFLGEDEFDLTDDQLSQSSSCSSDNCHLESVYDFTLSQSLRIARTRTRPLFDGYRVHVTKSVLPPPDQMYQIVKCGGGKSVARLPRGGNLDGVIVVSTEQDKQLCANALKSGVPVVNKEFILTGILQQKLDLEKNRLFSAENRTKASSLKTPVQKPSPSIPMTTRGRKDTNYCSKQESNPQSIPTKRSTRQRKNRR